MVLTALLGSVLFGCAEDRENVSNDQPELLESDAQVFLVAESHKSSYEDATDLDVYLMSMVEDMQTLAYVLRLVDPDLSENNKFIKDLLVDMLDIKLLSLTQFLSNTEDDRIIRLACKALERATADIMVLTNSCSDSRLCERSNDLALVCVAEGFATHEEIEIPLSK